MTEETRVADEDVDRNSDHSHATDLGGGEVPPSSVLWTELFRRVTTDSLLKMLEGIREALHEDDHLRLGSKRYGVREYPDFRIEADLIESELNARNVAYEPTPW